MSVGGSFVVGSYAPSSRTMPSTHHSFLVGDFAYCRIPPITLAGLVTVGSAPMLGSCQSSRVGRVKGLVCRDEQLVEVTCAILCSFSWAFSR